MADNLKVNEGSGSTSIATDEVGGAHYQRVKLTWGADGTADDVDYANPLPIYVAISELPEDAASETTLASIYDQIDLLVNQSEAVETTLEEISAQVALLDAAQYETVAASQTAQVLGAVGALGDDIDGLLIIPATTSPGSVLLLDNAISITVFAGGASSVGDLRPFHVPLHIKSVSGAWKVTTGANVSVLAMGKFT